MMQAVAKMELGIWEEGCLGIFFFFPVDYVVVMTEKDCWVFPGEHEIEYEESTLKLHFLF